jgi:hypothetical protein
MKRINETQPAGKYPRAAALPPSPAIRALGVLSLRNASASANGTRTSERHCIITAEGRVNVFDGGFRWTPAAPIPRDAQPNALAALARHAEAHEQNEREQIQTRRKAA